MATVQSRFQKIKCTSEHTLVRTVVVVAIAIIFVIKFKLPNWDEELTMQAAV